MSGSEQTKQTKDSRKEDAASPPIADGDNSIGLPVLRDRTGKTVRKPGKIVNLRRRLQLRKDYLRSMNSISGQMRRMPF